MIYQGNVYDSQNEIHFIKILREIAEIYPEKDAIVWEGKKITYSELDRVSEAIGVELISRGVKPNEVVAVRIPYSLDVITAIIGIWKARAAFVYIDDRAPEDRNQYIIESSKCKQILESPFINSSREKSKNVKIGKLPEGALEDLAFILFTSGSTGHPKGVMIEQGSIAAQNLLGKQMKMRADDVNSMLGGFSFMSALFQVFPILTVGGTLKMIPQGMRRDLDQIVKWYEEEGITIGYMPPHVATQFVQKKGRITNFRMLLSGGEPIHNMDAMDYEINCVYGTSEACIVSVCKIHSKSEDYPIGDLVPHMRVYVLDEEGNLVKPGEIGEVCVAGPQLARGYLMQPELTNQRFVKNPFSDEPRYRRIYKTGDMVRLCEDGNMFYECRNDLMVNIKSFRVELGDVESAMNLHPGIERGIVKPYKTTDGIDALCGYYFSAGPIEERELFAFLREKLPHYMVPERFVYLKQLPLTTNGKVDRAALLHPDEYHG